MEIETKERIIERRKEIERELSEYLVAHKSEYDLEDIQELIYEEEETDDFTHLVAVFDTGQDPEELQNILETISDAWNYFPHGILGGVSPAEKLLEHQSKR